MNDTTTRKKEICHSVLKTHIETDIEQKASKDTHLTPKPTNRYADKQIFLRPDGYKMIMQFDPDRFLRLNDEYGPITLVRYIY